MTDLNALVIFAKVVEAKGFSEAARRLRMPVSTVSRRVAELEDQLGVRLLDRSTRALRLTVLGSEVLEHAQRSAEASEAVENIISNQQSNVTWHAAARRPVSKDIRKSGATFKNVFLKSVANYCRPCRRNSI